MSERLAFAGHSTVFLEASGARLLTDPILRERVLHIRRHSDPVAPELTSDLDAVLISHLHPDHLDFPSLRELGRDVRIVAPNGSRRLFERRGFENVEEVVAGESVEVKGATIEARSVVHDGRRYPVGARIEALGYVIRGESSYFFAGDTAPFDMSGVRGVDVALLPVAGWGPNLRHEHHLDPRTAAEAAATISPRIAVPIHWGSMLRMGLHRRKEELMIRPATEFAVQVAKLAPGVETRVIAPGEATAIEPAD